MTDHKPLMAILGPKRGVPALAAARLQRWVILLLGYQYLEFRTSKQHANADVFLVSPGQRQLRMDIVWDLGRERLISTELSPYRCPLEVFKRPPTMTHSLVGLFAILRMVGLRRYVLI